jgi:hypothetical protein
MKKVIGLVAVALCVCFSIPLAAQLRQDVAISRAEALLKNLQDGRTADIVKEFDERLTKELPEAKLKPVWQGLVSQFGAFKGIAERREGPMQFEKQTIVHRTVYDSAGRVAGLVFRPLDGAVLPANK